MFAKIETFIKGLFLDDVGEPCIGRLSLFVGLLLTPLTAIWFMDSEITMNWSETVVRCSPGIIGLIAYIFTRLAEMKEWIAEHVKDFTGEKNAEVQKTV